MILLKHHDLLLENLLIVRKLLINRCIEKAETAKGTNWEQKFQKPQNENICLSNLNVESLCKPRVEPNLFELYRGAAKFRLKQNNGNFSILAFGDCMENGARTKQIDVYVQDTCFAIL